MSNDAPRARGQTMQPVSLDETRQFTPQFDATGILPAIAINHDNGEVLMLAYMNKEALMRTLETGEVHYWSRSRQCLWHKGATSGHLQKLVDVKTDCDQDALLLRVIQLGGACHTGRASCFYRRIEWDAEDTHIQNIALSFSE